MLSVFPSLLAFGLLAPLLLRLALGLVFVNFGWHKLARGRADKTAFFESLGWKPGEYFAFGFGVVELVVGVMLIVGIYTQIAAFVAALISLGALALKRRTTSCGIESTRGFLALLFIISLSLLVLGAGLFAFDLPL
ncbi:MAG: DoxX family protein [Parcubacteria group bacterium GW2011_GWA2_47_12]|nr:MAG: DoxX family protein [Parcubacteria group bacterium GW2011_GWA2_47_12]